MNLLYIWNYDYFHASEAHGYLLNSKYDIQFDESQTALTIKKNENYIHEFWGRHIYDVMAIVGDNGSGKTKLASCIMHTLTEIYSNYDRNKRFIIIFQGSLQDGNRLSIFTTAKYNRLTVDSSDPYTIHYIFHDEKIMFGYFTNAFQFDDFIRKKPEHIFDASMGGCLNNSIQNKNRNGTDAADMILNYHRNEITDIIHFLTSNLSDVEIPFHIPRHMKISLVNYQEHLASMHTVFSRKNIAESQDMLQVLQQFCTEIKTMQGTNWMSSFLINLLLNLFSEICFSQKDAQSELTMMQIFLNRLEYWISFSHLIPANTPDLDIFGYAKQIFIYLAKYLPAEERTPLKNRKKIFISGCITKYLKFIIWMEKNYASLNQNIADNRLTLHQQDYALLNYYGNTSSFFPYFAIDFGLSTGEFNFLNLFSKIARFREKLTLEKTACAILYFDEADLSLHPKWQQTYVHWLLQFISTYFRMCTVQIFIATHSPIMLSDFPKDNVLYLWKKDDMGYARKRNIRTFGNNIHTLFLDSFFLDKVGTMGAFAEKKINNLASSLNSPDRGHVLNEIELIGDDIIRNRLYQMYQKNNVKEALRTTPDTNTIDAEIQFMKNRIKSLEAVKKELEKTKHEE